jgi:hypothetical protein
MNWDKVDKVLDVAIKIVFAFLVALLIISIQP